MRSHVLLAALLMLSLGAAVGCGQRSAKVASPLASAAPGEVVHLDKATFESATARPVPVLVDFWAPWCGPCRIQGPILEDVAKRVGDTALIAKVNVDDEKGLAARFQVQAIPTLVLLKEGRELRRFVGVQQAEDLVRALQSAQ